MVPHNENIIEMADKMTGWSQIMEILRCYGTLDQPPIFVLLSPKIIFQGVRCFSFFATGTGSQAALRTVLAQFIGSHSA